MIHAHPSGHRYLGDVLGVLCHLDRHQKFPRPWPAEFQSHRRGRRGPDCRSVAYILGARLPTGPSVSLSAFFAVTSWPDISKPNIGDALFACLGIVVSPHFVAGLGRATAIGACRRHSRPLVANRRCGAHASRCSRRTCPGGDLGDPSIRLLGDEPRLRRAPTGVGHCCHLSERHQSPLAPQRLCAQVPRAPVVPFSGHSRRQPSQAVARRYGLKTEGTSNRRRASPACGQIC